MCCDCIDGKEAHPLWVRLCYINVNNKSKKRGVLLCWLLILGRLNYLAEGGRHGSLEVHQFVCHGMHEREAVVVQHEPAYGIGVATILAVAGYGVPYVGKLYAYLVLAAGEYLQVEQRVMPVALHHTVACHGQASLVGLAGDVYHHIIVVLHEVVA